MEEQFLHRRMDYRKGHPELASHRFPNETVEQKNSRLGLSDMVMVDKVYIRRSDGVIKLLSIIYDSRVETYEGLPVHRDSISVLNNMDKRYRGHVRKPLRSLQYSSHANSGDQKTSLNPRPAVEETENNPPLGRLDTWPLSRRRRFFRI
jgi:hypothetical protein